MVFYEMYSVNEEKKILFIQAKPNVELLRIEIRLKEV